MTRRALLIVSLVLATVGSIDAGPALAHARCTVPDQATSTSGDGAFSPSLAGSGTLVAYESTANPTGGNADLNNEVFFTDTATGTTTQLTSTAPGAVNDGAAISADGTTVVGDASVEGDVHAFVWTQADGMRDLNDLAGPEAAGWVLYSAAAVSADGAVIAGEGENPAGKSEAWVLDLPEPQRALGALAACGALASLRTLRARSPRRRPGSRW